jgi:histidyl-tRNA synthetase
MPRRKKEDQPQEEIKTIKTPSLVEGTKDVLPADQKYWSFVEKELFSIINDYSFTRLDTPILEKYELFNHTLFKQSGLLEKESFNFVDRGQKLIMRPEIATAVARAFASHNMVNQTMPIKAYTWGPVFRQGKIESQKLRQFMQVSFEILGDSSPAIDAELIIVANAMIKNLGIESEVKLNSVGCATCRPEYKKALTGYLKSKRSGVCADCRKYVTRDPLKFLNCASNKCGQLYEDAPQMVDWLCDDCRNHLFKVLEYLDELKVSYHLDATLTRTFDYHTQTVFEIFPAGDEEDKVSLVGGGRYNYLVQMVGGPETPAVGFSLGIDRLVNQVKRAKVELPKPKGPDVFLAQISDQARQNAFAVFESLRKENFTVKANLSKASLKAQLDIANKLGAKLVLILGQKEVVEGTIILRDVESGIQEVINRDKAIKEIKKRLKEKQD